MRNKLILILNKLLMLIILVSPYFILQSSEVENLDNFPGLFQSVILIRNESFLSESVTKPWMKESISTGYGTGVVITGNRILTNAHVVRDSKYITVQKYNKKKNYKATVKFIAIDCDLAILNVEDEEFFEGLNTFPIHNSYPPLGSELLIIGYPNGSENLSVERANVISLEKARYSFSGLDIRNIIKVNSKIVPGNSGSPAVRRGKMVGLIFQISQLNNDVAYIIPTEIINHFLNDIDDGKYDGFPNIGFTFQNGENNSIKNYYKIPIITKGILVNTVYPGSSFYDYIKPGDYIYKIDDNYLTSEGEVLDDKKLFITDYFESKFVGDPITLYFYRGGKKFKATSNVKLTEFLNIYREDNLDYYLNSGLVFQPISKIFFSKSDPEVFDSSAKYHFSYYIQDRLYRYTDRDVLLGYVFDDPENFRYKEYRFKVVETINGYTPKNIDNFSELWNRFKSETIIIKFRGISLPIVITPINRNRINTRVRKRFGVESNEPL